MKNYVIFNGGNIGIGTTSPQAKLDVSGDGSAVIVPRKSTAGDPAGINGMIYYNTNSNKFRVFENGAWRDLVGGGGFGNWVDLTSSFSWDTAYGPVATDGFVTLQARGYHGGGGAIGWTDGNPNPTTKVIGEGAGYVDYSHGITMPVKKGHYWKISRTATGYGNTEIHVRWIPLGN